MSHSRVITHSASGSSCTIHDYGATLTSFKTSDGRECLFLSRDARLDGTKAIRGGIPLVFPQFGQPEKTMPQHGFLRNNWWKVDEKSSFDTAESAGIRYTLAYSNVENGLGGKWTKDNTARDCSCTYSIELSGKQLKTTLEINNTGKEAFEFQTLQHTYLMVDDHNAQDATQCYVKGLEGYTVSDKISNEEYTLPVAADAEPVTIPGLVDRVHTPPAGWEVVEVAVGVGGGKRVKLMASGMVDGTAVPVSCVVWNPFEEKAAAMNDFGNDQYKDMICVEPGILGNPKLEAGKSASLTQTLQMEDQGQDLEVQDKISSL